MINKNQMCILCGKVINNSCDGYKYHMTMSFYPEEERYLNDKRWKQVKTFNSHEEFKEWRDNHPWTWNVINVDKIEELK